MTDSVSPDFGAENITVEMFGAHLDSEFHVVTEEGEIVLLLVEVTAPQTAAGFERFSLTFYGPPDALLPDGMQTFRHESLGWFAIFMVPVLESNSTRIVYQASFNRRARQ